MLHLHTHVIVFISIRPLYNGNIDTVQKMIYTVILGALNFNNFPRLSINRTRQGSLGRGRINNILYRRLFTYARERCLAGVRVGVVGHRKQPRTLLFGLQTHWPASVHPVTAAASLFRRRPGPVRQDRGTRPQSVSVLQTRTKK